MKAPLIVVDAHYLCHRAFHSTKELSWKNRPTGVIYSFLRCISQFKDQFQTDRIAFCFEHAESFRKELYPSYKSKRGKRAIPAQEKASYDALRVQISELKNRYLPEIGFKNVFSFRGMESDDIMASIALFSDEDDVIIVTADSDLWQCLRSNVKIWNPQKNKLMTEAWFRKEYKIRPSQWAVVKAIAGCSSDSVDGIKGVGEKSALYFVRGKMSYMRPLQRQRIRSNKAIVMRNKALVKLPFKGCPIPEIQEDKISKEKWLSVIGRLGMRSLAGHLPVASRKLGSYSTKRIQQIKQQKLLEDRRRDDYEYELHENLIGM